jgi:hypothetical protein
VSHGRLYFDATTQIFLLIREYHNIMSCVFFIFQEDREKEKETNNSGGR